jgi:DNA repair exonuclease SbcCD nuclease subunit
MFTFIHAADIHLDSPLVGLSQHEDAPVEIIRGATRTALTRLVDLAIDREVHFVIIAGDLYDGDWKDYGTGLFFVKEMRRLEKAKIPVYLIFGNHDAESKTTKSLELPENVHVFDTRSAESLPHPDLPVILHGQGFATQSVTENLAGHYPAAVPDHFNIGLLHTNLGDAAGHGNYAPSTLPQLVAHGYDYWALGHIHLRHIHHEKPHVVYSGNTQGRHINEPGAKGCYLVTVDDELEVTDTEFCPLDSVRWESLTIDCSEIEDEVEIYQAIRDELASALEAADGRLLAARVVLSGSCKLHEKLHAEHSRFLAECVSQAAAIDSELIWIESLRLKTRSLLDPQELAKRDDLTALVLEALDSFDPGVLPDSVTALKAKLPEEAINSLKSSLSPESEADNETIKQDVAAIVLQAIATSSD